MTGMKGNMSLCEVDVKAYRGQCKSLQRTVHSLQLKRDNNKLFCKL